MRDLEGLLQVSKRVVVSHQDNRVAGAYGDRFCRDAIARRQTELIHRGRGMNLFGAPAFVYSF